MILAEALIKRADLQRYLAELKHRIQANALHQEGETPAEDPQELLALYCQGNTELEGLIVAINLSNNRIRLADGTLMVAALAKREALKNAHAVLMAAAQAATPEQQRYSRSEIKMLSALSVKELRQEADRLAQAARELDIQIQAANWANALVE